MNIFFGTDGWRAIIDKEINTGSVMLVAQAFADYTHSVSKETRPKIAIAYDGRKHSFDYAELFASVLSGNKIDVFLSDRIIPTPVLSWFVADLKLDAGVMITASHNPPQYNGVKFKGHYGGPFFTEETHKVENLLGKSKVKKDFLNVLKQDFTKFYTRHLLNIIDFSLISNSGLKVIVDSMGGAGETFLQDILLDTDLEIDTIFGNASADFYGRNAEPIEKNLSLLSETLANEPYSIGLATDGDADRLGVMYDGGGWQSAQDTILMLADYYSRKSSNRGPVIKTASVTNKLNQLFGKQNREVEEVQVGFKYICEKMISDNALFGCEESGGFGYAGHIPERDGILSALLMIEMLASSGAENLSSWQNEKWKEWGKIFYKREDFLYDVPERAEILPGIFREIPGKISGFNISSIKEFSSSRGIINGLKLYFDDNQSWLLLRSSETEPLFRVYAESVNDLSVKHLLQYGIKLIKDYGKY